MASIRPSTYSGTPLIMRSGAGPSRAGQFWRIRSKLAPIPPDVTITAGACSSNRPTSLRELRVPRAASLGARTAPRTPSTAPPVPEPESDPAVRLGFPHPFYERRQHPGPGAPGDVETRHRVAVPVGQVAAAFGPADQREPA